MDSLTCRRCLTRSSPLCPVHRSQVRLCRGRAQPIPETALWWPELSPELRVQVRLPHLEPTLGKKYKVSVPDNCFWKFCFKLWQWQLLYMYILVIPESQQHTRRLIFLLSCYVDRGPENWLGLCGMVCCPWNVNFVPLAMKSSMVLRVTSILQLCRPSYVVPITFEKPLSFHSGMPLSKFGKPVPTPVLPDLKSSYQNVNWWSLLSFFLP